MIVMIECTVIVLLNDSIYPYLSQCVFLVYNIETYITCLYTNNHNSYSLSLETKVNNLHFPLLMSYELVK